MGLETVVNFPRGPSAFPAEGNMTNTNFWTWRIFNFLTIKPKQNPPWCVNLVQFEIHFTVNFRETG